MKEDLLCMLDWHMPEDVQALGITAAKKESNIWMFIQPMSADYNKSVWENCAKVLKDKPDDMLLPYLIPLIEWLQDLTWPGAEIILARLSVFLPIDLSGPISYSIMRAIEHDDITWLNNISTLIQQSGVTAVLDREIYELLHNSINHS